MPRAARGHSALRAAIDTEIVVKRDREADPGFEALMRDDIRQETAIALDRAAIAGTGASDQPTGILNTAPKVLEFTAAVEFANAAVGNLGWLTNAKVKGQMMQTERAEGTAKFILDDQAEARLAGYRVAFSNIVPADGTKSTGTNLSAMIFGNWKDLLIGEFGGMDGVLRDRDGHRHRLAADGTGGGFRWHAVSPPLSAPQGYRTRRRRP
jgi:HK97 family phage major capsid protein